MRLCVTSRPSSLGTARRRFCAGLSSSRFRLSLTWVCCVGARSQEGLLDDLVKTMAGHEVVAHDLLLLPTGSEHHDAQAGPTKHGDLPPGDASGIPPQGPIDVATVADWAGLRRDNDDDIEVAAS